MKIRTVRALRFWAGVCASCIAGAVHHARIYALETFTGFCAPAPSVANTGTVVRLARDGSWRTIVGGLSFPTAMTFGGHNTLYISNKGFEQPTNTSGEIVKVQVPDTGD